MGSALDERRQHRVAVALELRGADPRDPGQLSERPGTGAAIACSTESWKTTYGGTSSSRARSSRHDRSRSPAGVHSRVLLRACSRLRVVAALDAELDQEPRPLPGPVSHSMRFARVMPT